MIIFESDILRRKKALNRDRKECKRMIRHYEILIESLNNTVVSINNQIIKVNKALGIKVKNVKKK